MPDSFLLLPKCPYHLEKSIEYSLRIMKRFSKLIQVLAFDCQFQCLQLIHDLSEHILKTDLVIDFALFVNV